MVSPELALDGLRGRAEPCSARVSDPADGGTAGLHGTGMDPGDLRSGSVARSGDLATTRGRGAAEALGGSTPTPPAPPLQGGEGSLAAYVVRCSCDTGPNGDIRRTVVDHVGLFPVSQNVRWTYAVHEQILPALRQAKVPVHWTDITVRHTGYSDPALRQRRLERDRKILEA